jgi:hypothetical protein
MAERHTVHRRCASTEGVSLSQAHPPQSPKSDTNVMGLIGMIMSIMGFVTLISAPIGLVLSLFGLRHPQKGMAIAGVIVGILSTAYAAVIGLIMLTYFGTIGACCCVAIGAAREQQAQEQAAKAAVAPLLNRTADQIEIEGMYVPSFESGAQDASGEAVYTDDAGAKKVVDFSATFEKVDGAWQVTNVTIDSEPRDWVEFDFEDDSDSDEDAADETGDAGSSEVSPDENGNTGPVTTEDNQSINVGVESESAPTP